MLAEPVIIQAPLTPIVITTLPLILSAAGTMITAIGGVLLLLRGQSKAATDAALTAEKSGARAEKIIGAVEHVRTLADGTLSDIRNELATAQAEIKGLRELVATLVAHDVQKTHGIVTAAVKKSLDDEREARGLVEMRAIELLSERTQAKGATGDPFL